MGGQIWGSCGGGKAIWDAVKPEGGQARWGLRVADGGDSHRKIFVSRSCER